MTKTLLINALIIISTKVLHNFEDGPAVYQATEPVDHSEGPSWDPRTNLLYFVDIHSGKVLSYNYENGDVKYITLDGQVTPVVQSVDKDVILVGVNRSVVAVEWNGLGELKGQKVLTTVSQQYPTSRFNDGKADKKGRLWWGTMGYEDSNGNLTPNQGVFYKITADNLENPQVILAPVNISNGLAWNKANDKLFYIDTPTNKIVSFNFNLEEGTISNRTVVFDLADHPDIAGHPDGMTIDEDDNLWIALYGGGSILHVNSKTGKLIKRIALPALNITSAMFGGPNLDVLFVTSSRFTLSEQQKKEQPAAGAVFAIKNLKTKGLPVYQANLSGSKTDCK
ncbi:regucalcin [Aethina tumida]|uniref:regucalcin n=1 Tax=Aethina tumida TaxID=116153 RepID=UPI0021486D2D|nr:regucalcin [Aethina tumida]